MNTLVKKAFVLGLIPLVEACASGYYQDYQSSQSYYPPPNGSNTYNTYTERYTEYYPSAPYWNNNPYYGQRRAYGYEAYENHHHHHYRHDDYHDNRPVPVIVPPPPTIITIPTLQEFNAARPRQPLSPARPIAPPPVPVYNLPLIEHRQTPQSQNYQQPPAVQEYRAPQRPQPMQMAAPVEQHQAPPQHQHQPPAVQEHQAPQQKNQRQGHPN